MHTHENNLRERMNYFWMAEMSPGETWERFTFIIECDLKLLIYNGKLGRGDIILL